MSLFDRLFFLFIRGGKKKEPFTIKAESAILFPSAAPVPSSKALNSQIARAVGRCFFLGRGQKKKAVKTVLIARVKDRCD